MKRKEAKAILYEWQQSMVKHGVPLDTSKVQALRVAIEALGETMANKEAIYVLMHIYRHCDWDKECENHGCEKCEEALNMAIDALNEREER